MEYQYLKNIKIKNFKSIKEINLDTKRLNMFIGQPNVGKSNILEALALFSALDSNKKSLREYIRLNNYSNLFSDGEIKSPVQIGVDKEIIDIRYENEKFTVKLNGSLAAILDNEYNAKLVKNNPHNKIYGGSKVNYTEVHYPIRSNATKKIKLYRIKNIKTYSKGSLTSLETPFGENLPVLIFNNLILRNIASDTIEEFDFELQLRPDKNEIEILKKKDGVNIAFPLYLSADTLKSMLFYEVLIACNENSTLLLEEPETHTFPFYTQNIAEKIAQDENNQYFITTHNPYFLEAIIDKSKKSDLQVILVYIKNHETRLKVLDKNDLDTLRMGDPFFTLDKLEV